MIMQTLGDREREMAAINGAYTHFIEGMIYSPAALGGSELENRRDHTPLVLLGERSSDGIVDHVGIDNVAAARTATEHLISTGRCRIAFIGSQERPDSAIASLRSAGYRQALTDAGLPTDPELIVPTVGYHRADGTEAMRRLLTRPRRPDAIFCVTDLLAQGAIRVLLETGLRIPEDVAVAGFDDIDESRYSSPTLTSISPDNQQIAETAVTRLFERGMNDDLPPCDTVTEFTLEIRESSRG